MTVCTHDEMSKDLASFFVSSGHGVRFLDVLHYFSVHLYCWMLERELSRRPCFRSGAAATSPLICCFGELLVRGCIDTDYMVRILNRVVNHYMFLFYTLLKKKFYALLEHIFIHYWSTFIYIIVGLLFCSFMFDSDCFMD
jgi:hypothetical protein